MSPLLSILMILNLYVKVVVRPDSLAHLENQRTMAFLPRKIDDFHEVEMGLKDL
jgi:hypothetical protein